MNELRRIFSHQLRIALGALALGCLVPFQVALAQVTDPAFDRFRAQVIGNNVNFSYGGAGTPLAGAGNTTGIGVSSGVDVSRGATINTKHGPITGTLTQKISSSAMGKAVGRVASVGGLASPVGLAFLAAPLVIDWFTDAGLDLDENNVPVRTVVVDIGCNAYPQKPNFTACGAWTPTPVLPEKYVKVEGGVRRCYQRDYCMQSGGALVLTYDSFDGPAAAEVTEQQPATSTDIETALSSVTSPSPAALSELYKLGGTLDLAHPIPDLVDTIRGEWEARSPESVTETSTSTPAEDKTEEKRCATYTQWVGQTLSLVEQCTTTTTTQEKDPATGDPVGDPKVTTSTTTDSTPDAKMKEDSEDSLLCKAFPKIAACAELGEGTGDIPKTERNVTYTPESVFGSGTCPADKIVTAYGMTLQLTNMAQACDLLATYVKPIAILLAAFTALMIVAVGVPE